MTRVLAVLVFVACGGSPYADTTAVWTRHTTMRGELQEALDLSVTYKSAEWRSAHAERDATNRGLTGAARDAVLAQAKADMAGPYELELLVATWDRRENDLDRGKKSVWRVVLIDDAGKEIEPLEILKDKRSPEVLRSEFPALTDFDTAYIARFPHTQGLGAIKLRMSSERGGVELVWAAP